MPWSRSGTQIMTWSMRVRMVGAPWFGCRCRGPILRPAERRSARSPHGGEADAGDDEGDAREVEPARVFPEEDRGERDGEGRHEVHPGAGARGAQAPHRVAPAEVGEKERADPRVGEGRNAERREPCACVVRELPGYPRQKRRAADA